MLEVSEIYKKYAQEIEITKRRIIDHISILSIPEIEDLRFSLEPRNNSEKAAKEDYSHKEAQAMGTICVNRSIVLVKEAYAKKIKKYHKTQEKLAKKAKK